jgi:hypothetical protein
MTDPPAGHREPRDIEKLPLSAVSEVWARDQQGRRPVFIP